MESYERGSFLTTPTGHQLGPDGLGGLAEIHETSPFLSAPAGQQPRQQQSGYRGNAADGVEAVSASLDLEKPRQSYATPRVWNWPDISGHVHEFPMPPTVSIFPDIVLVLMSLLFLCFAIMALCIRNRPTGDEFGAIMEEAMRLVSRSMLVPIFIANSLWPYYIPYYICSYRREGFEEDWEISGGKRS